MAEPNGEQRIIGNRQRGEECGVDITVVFE